MKNSRRLFLQWSLFEIIFLHLLNMSFCQNQCGLPSNLTSYPRFAQEEIRAVWKNYIPGTKCDQELLITEDIFTVLNSFNKEIDKDMPAMPIIDLGQDQEMLSQPTPTQVMPAMPIIDMSQNQEMLSQPTPTQVMPAIPIIDMRQNQEMLPQPTTTQTTTSATTTTTSTSKLEATTEHDYLDFILPGNPTPGHFIPITSTSALFSSTISNLVESPKPINGDTNDDYDYLDKKDPLGARPLIRPVKPKKPTQIFSSFVENSRQNSESAQTDESNDYDEIHLLAVSYLDDHQLKSFNIWSARRRKHLHLHDDPPLSRRARNELKALAALPEAKRRARVLHLPAKIKQELRRFALRRKSLSI